jgi:hypothetical protein
MHSIIVALFSALLFFVLTPGVFLRLPKNGSKFAVAGVHALVFAIIFHFTHRSVYKMFRRLEGFQEPIQTNKKELLEKCQHILGIIQSN